MGRRSPSPRWVSGAAWGGAGAGGAAAWGGVGAAAGGGASWAPPGLVDSEALIAVELCLVKGEGDSEDLRIANILFNNLDIIGKCHLYMFSFRRNSLGAVIDF